MSKDNLTLSQCTKADLLWIIEYLTRFGDEYKLKHALNELWYEKEKQRIDEAGKYAKRADEKRRKYIELMRPYEGQRWADIPHDTIVAADKLLREARNADKMYMKLIGIKEK